MSLQRQATNIVLDYVRTQYPYWNASLGRDHIWTLTTDQGFCGFSQFGETHDELASSVILSHWGLTKPEVTCHPANTGLSSESQSSKTCRMVELGSLQMGKSANLPRSLHLQQLPSANQIGLKRSVTVLTTYPMQVPCGLEERIATFGRCRERQEVEALAALGHHKPLSRPCFIPKKVCCCWVSLW